MMGKKFVAVDKYSTSGKPRLKKIGETGDEAIPMCVDTYWFL